MNRKGQLGLGAILLAFISIIVGIVLLISASNQAGLSTQTMQVTNYSLTAPTINNQVDIPGQLIMGSPVVTNATDGAVVGAGNYTIGSAISKTTGANFGYKTNYYNTTFATYAGKAVYITYSYGEHGYAEDSATRSIITLIIIFGALAVAVIALSPTLRSGLVDLGK